MREPEQAPAPEARLGNKWRRYLRFWGPRADADVDDELRFHFEMRVRDYVARGYSEAAARDAVTQRLGNLQSVRAECVTITARRDRRAARALFVDAMVQDVRFALRTLAREKGWTAAAVLTLSLGIGANTAVFSVVHNLILRPLSYPHADRLALVFQEPTTGNTTGIPVRVKPRPAVVRAWLEQARSFDALEPFHSSDMTMEERDRTTATVPAAWVRPTFLALAGERPILGRMFTAAEAENGAQVALLSERLWRTRYGGDPNAIGQSMKLGDRVYTVIGVTPARLRLPRLDETAADLWLPLRVTDESSGILIGRLRPGGTIAGAEQELDAIDARLEDTKAGQGRFRAKLTPPSEMIGFRDSLVLLSGAVALVLLIACANVAHLLLARGATRQRELAIRAAIGAARLRLVRQLLTESFVLAAAGCAGGVLVGALGVRAVVAVRPATLVELSAAALDTVTLLLTIGLSVVTGIGFGLVGAVQAARQSTHESLKAGTRSSSRPRRQHRARSLLVVSEMALATTLLVGATLLVRSIVHIMTRDPGFEPRGLYSVMPTLPARRYTEATRQDFYRRFLESVRAVPGVDGATFANGAPPGYHFVMGALQIEGTLPPPPGTSSFLRYNAVDPNYFRVLGIPLLEGTTFTDSTRRGGQLVVSEGFARKYWRDGSAVGRQVRVIGYDGKGDWLTIVGVVGDASTGGLTDLRSDPILYRPEPEYNRPEVIIRARDGVDVIPSVRALLSSMDPQLAPPTIQHVAAAMAASAERPRFTMVLLATFTGIALVLAAIGLYGVMAYAVAQRTREIGIRMALGATRRAIGRVIVRNGLVLAVTGAGAGVVAAWWATKLLEKMLYGVTRTDPASFALGVAVLLATSAVACVVPMRRAAAVDPAIAMKAD